jgi:hypothetical protein
VAGCGDGRRLRGGRLGEGDDRVVEVEVAAAEEVLEGEGESAALAEAGPDVVDAVGVGRVQGEEDGAGARAGLCGRAARHEVEGVGTAGE